MNDKPIIVIGAGLCGSLLTIRLAQLGYQVQLIEKRADLRKEELPAGRSINLALSNRGLKALDMVGLKGEAERLCLPMKGRMIHDKAGNTTLQRYSGRDGDYINSISRPGLNSLLLDKAEAYDNVILHFNTPCIGVNPSDTTATIISNGSEKVIEADAIFGTDGAGSAVRNSFLAHSASLRFDFSQQFLSHGYKELSILADENGEFQMDDQSLHIWPRGDFMLIALPNLDKSFTVTLFLSFEGSKSFDALRTSNDVAVFFEREFPDAFALMPHLKDEFAQNPTGPLGTIKCYPWAVNKTMLLGDAAHAVVPFYGQGMNASFEDVTVLDEVLKNFTGSWDEVMAAYQQRRKQNADAIADLALDNFYEMRDHVADEVYKRKRKLETALEANYQDYFSKYSLVTFREDLPYAIAMKKGREQDEFLMNYCRENNDVNVDDVYKLIKSSIR